MSSSIAAVELIVIDVDTSARGMPSNSARTSSTESIATPTFPTSPAALRSSESRPICVGRSKATERPVWPAARSALNRAFVAFALPNPAYWRIVQRRPRYIDS